MKELRNEILDCKKRIAEVLVLLTQEIDVHNRLTEKLVDKCLTKEENYVRETRNDA